MAQAWKPKFAEITALTHTEQAIWWLNGFWEEGADKEAENIWEWAHHIIEIETGVRIRYGQRKVDVKEGCDLDEMKAHVFLEKLGETLTVRALRKRLTEIDIDNNKKMALSEYLLARFNRKPIELVNSDQGSGVPKAEMDAANERFENLQTQFGLVSAAAEQAAEDAKNAAADAEQAKLDEIAAEKAAAAAAEAQTKAEQKAEEAAKAEAELMVLENELREAVEAVAAEEKKIQDKKDALNQVINGDGGAVSKNKARNELAQIEAEDPLPLRKAKITQSAALKRAEKARQPASDARAAAEAEAAAAGVARQAADKALAAAKVSKEHAVASAAKAAQAQKDLEAQRAQLEQDLAEAQAVLQELKSRKGTPHGKIWWMERQVQEAQKFMPRK